MSPQNPQPGQPQPEPQPSPQPSAPQLQPQSQHYPQQQPAVNPAQPGFAMPPSMMQPQPRMQQAGYGAAPTIQTTGSLLSGVTIFSPKTKGYLSLVGNQLSFTDSTTNAVLISGVPGQIEKVSVGVNAISIKVMGKSYRFMAQGAVGSDVFAALFGGLLSLFIMKKVGDDAGIPQWRIALQNAGFHTKDYGFGKSMKWGLIVVGVIVALIVILMVITLLSGSNGS